MSTLRDTRHGCKYTRFGTENLTHEAYFVNMNVTNQAEGSRTLVLPVRIKL